LARFGKPEIFNADSQKIEASSRVVQGAQFTSTEFTGALAVAGIKISMDGKGRWMDNVFIERLWRSLTYEDVSIKGYTDGTELRAGLAEWMGFYNHYRPHQALGNRAPMAIWREAMIGALPPMAEAMTLAVAASLDDATASTTSPQPQQQQKAA
jgi:putative transposase